MKARDVVPFDVVCRTLLIPTPQSEYRFDPDRKWRFDWAWVRHRVALEVNGGVWIAGRHSRGRGQIADFEKWSEAAAQGWRMLHVIPTELQTEKTLDMIRRALRL